MSRRQGAAGRVQTVTVAYFNKGGRFAPTVREGTPPRPSPGWGGRDSTRAPGEGRGGGQG